MTNLPKHCPHCNYELEGEDIFQYFKRIYPDNEKEAYLKASMYGWHEDSPKKFSHALAHYSRELDRTLEWWCPSCEKEI